MKWKVQLDEPILEHSFFCFFSGNHAGHLFGEPYRASFFGSFLGVSLDFLIRPHLWGGLSSFGHSSWEPYRESFLGSSSDLLIAHSTTFVGRALFLGSLPFFFIG